MIDLQNERGLTLVEILAGVVIAALFGTIAYAIIFGLYNNYEKISTEANLRDEADLIMVEFIETLYTLPLSQMDETSLPETGTENYYIVTKKGNTFGFIDHKVIVQDREISLRPEIKLVNGSKIIEIEDGLYQIIISLEADNGRKLEVKSEIKLNDDLGDEKNES